MDIKMDSYLPHSQNEMLFSDFAFDAAMDETIDIVNMVNNCNTIPPPLTESVEKFEALSPYGPPEGGEVPGHCNFTVEVTSKDAHKKKFLYSNLLGRIYVDMNCDFSILFNWDQSKCPSPDMYVRATTVFADADQSQKRVERCRQHCDDGTDMLKQIAMNVLHSSRALNTEGVYYCGDPKRPDSWYSVLVHFRKTSTEPRDHAYRFTCKSSCASGINRRAIAIIFSLEDQFGAQYGRQQVGVKVCSCLRRDMLKDEEAEGALRAGKRRLPGAAPPRPATKKIKLEAPDLPNMLVLPKITVEANAMISGLRTMVDMMTTAGLHNPEVVEKYAPSIAELRKVLTSLEAPTTPPQ